VDLVPGEQRDLVGGGRVEVGGAVAQPPDVDVGGDGRQQRRHRVDREPAVDHLGEPDAAGLRAAWREVEELVVGHCVV
jgi:hypothetical protein